MSLHSSPAPRPVPRPLRSVHALVSAGLCLLLSACGGEAGPKVPPGLEPLEASLAPAPAAVGSVLPEALNVVKGDRSEYGYAHGHGYIRAPIARVVAALRTPDALVDRRQVAEWKVDHDTEPEFPVSFRVTNVVKDSRATVSWDARYRQGAIEGSQEAPEVYVSRSELSSESFFMQVLRDSIVVRRVDDQVTEIEMVRHLAAIFGMAGKDDAEQYVNDVFDSLVALSHGEPLPIPR